MDAPAVVIASALIVSLAANAFLAVKLRASKTEPKYTYDAQALLRDLLQGQALLRIERIAPEQVFLRSPRDV
jgi:hypothetical protein